ncbi:MAG: reverse transcriptase family protein [Gammaproteobacteria bacterium]|nr:reverse transcriptase family protein [Gammaproteobacteria bacterium]
MHHWNPQQFRKAAEEEELDPKVLDNAVSNAEIIRTIDPRLPPVFSLRHLAHYAEVDYSLLRRTVERDGDEPYISFKLKKNGKSTFRIICAPDTFLLKTQRWIAQNILSVGAQHHSSVAYAKSCNIVDAASIHCGCRWLIKLDVANFFESFSEIAAYRVFRSFGYQALISFEMARLCTRLGGHTHARSGSRWYVRPNHNYKIDGYKNGRIGHIPQGAPTSPMLTNLALRDFDRDIESIAAEYGMYYTRYADDMFFSTKDQSFNREKGRNIIAKLYARMKAEGFRPNIAKTRMHSPGARKIVLGLLVDGVAPKLTREFRSKIRMHLHYLKHEKIGPALHAQKRGFDSVMGLKNHIEGLISYAHQVQPELGARWRDEFHKIEWGAYV